MRGTETGPARRLRLLAAAAVLAGVGFRLYGLENKLFWRDEVTTALRLSGHSDAALSQRLCQSPALSRQDLLRYQDAGAGQSLGDTVEALKEEGGHHPPLHYLTARPWVRVFGGSAASQRGLPLLWGLLALWLLRLLCDELFSDPATGWICAALMSLSPVFSRYATEARDYSLWIALILGSSLALLRALRADSAAGWALYGATAAAALYAFPLSGLVIAAHGFYVLALGDFQRSRKTDAFCLAAAAAAAAFAPWAWAMLRRLAVMLEANDWSGHHPSLSSLFASWLKVVAGLFYETEYYAPRGFFSACAKAAAVGLVAYSLCDLRRRQPRRVWLFVALLLAPFAAAALTELLSRSGHRSGVHRYNFPLYIGALLACGALLSPRAPGASLGRARAAILALLAALGAGSMIATRGRPFRADHFTAISKLLTAARHPVVVCPMNLIRPLNRQACLADALVLSRVLPAEATFLFADAMQLHNLPPGLKEAFVFVYESSDSTMKWFVIGLQKEGWRATPLYGSRRAGPQLLRLEREKPSKTSQPG